MTWEAGRPCRHGPCARAALWQRDEQDAGRAVSSRSRWSLRQPWPEGTSPPGGRTQAGGEEEGAALKVGETDRLSHG